METSIDSSITFLESTRFWVQRVLVPIFVFIGVGGNGVTIVVLTRRRMRCTTNIYLTALAVADLIYLLFVLLLSFVHYPNIHDKKYELYWRFYGITHWLCDAASSTSVWLTVSFTVERYIAVCHPIKGKVLCTENRAKSIIALVSILCLMTTASTAFEHQLTLHEHCVRKCDLRDYNRAQENNIPNDRIDVDTGPILKDEKTIEQNLVPTPNDNTEKDVTLERPPCNISDYVQEDCENNVNEVLSQNDTFNLTCCEKSYSIDTEPTNLGKNKTYKTIIYWFSSVFFGLLPLLLIATFNCFLIHAVYKSQSRRKQMTNSSTQDSVNQSNENRITLLLIGVVIAFLICQSPTASFLIYEEFDDTNDPYVINIKKGLGNIFNFLITVNASCNFVLYCVLSGKYRRTFKTLFCERRINRQDTLALSLTGRNTQRLSSGKNGFRRNASEYYKTPRNLETQSLASMPRSKSLIARAPGKAKTSDLNI